MAETASVSVAASTSHSFSDADIPLSIRNDAFNLGLTHIGWTTTEISDGNLPATYYGAHATVTPAANTTYYAFFAKRSDAGTQIVRQITDPQDGDTVMAVLYYPPSSYYVVPNGSSAGGAVADISLTTKTASDFSDNIYKGSAVEAHIFRYELHDTDTFKLSAAYRYSPNYYLYAKTTTQLNIDKDATLARSKFVLKDNHLYNCSQKRYLIATIVSYKPYLRQNAAASDGTTLLLYRQERYTGFVTDIVNPCPNCFKYIP